MTTFHFGSGSFTNELWIDNKRLFAKPTAVDVEFTTGGAFDWIIADATGAVVKVQRHANTSAGWTSIHLPSLGLFADYSIGFRNAAPGLRQIKQGDVTYS